MQEKLNEVKSRISKVLATINSVDECKYESSDTLSSIFGDSLSILEAAMYLEDEFDINIANPHSMCTMGDVEQFILNEQGIKWTEN